MFGFALCNLIFYCIFFKSIFWLLMCFTLTSYSAQSWKIITPQISCYSWGSLNTKKSSLIWSYLTATAGLGFPDKWYIWICSIVLSACAYVCAGVCVWQESCSFLLCTNVFFFSFYPFSSHGLFFFFFLSTSCLLVTGICVSVCAVNTNESWMKLLASC